MKKFFALLAVAAVSFSATQAHALNVALTPTIVNAYNNATDFVPLAPLPAGVPGTVVTEFQAGVYQIDFAIDVTNLQAGEAGFANIGFNVVLGPGLTTELGGWQPNGQTVDSNGAAPGGVVPLFATNLDAGTPGDNVGILVSIAGGVTNAIDPRRTVGQAGAAVPGPAYIGSLYVTWDGVTKSTLSTDGILFQINSSTGQFGNTTSGVSSTVRFGDVPEPSSLVLGGLSLIGLAFRRRLA